MKRPRLVAVLAVGLGLAASGCGGGAARSTVPALVVVSAPLTGQPWVGTFARRGAELAAAQLGAGTVRVEVLDDGGSPQHAVANARHAVDVGAAALVTDGVGAEAVAQVSGPAQLPVFVVFEGGASVVDPVTRPTVFRLAPSNRNMSRRLAAYLSEKSKAVALLSDGSQYGREGAAETRAQLVRNEVRVTAEPTVPEGASDVAPQVLAARRSGATALVVWARPETVAAVVSAARGSGWQVPVYTGPTGEDPLVRQRLAAHPTWLDGLTFVSFRITSETGPEPFAAYRKAFEGKFGPDRIGVGDVVQPPDWSMLSYDAVRLVSAALGNAGGKTGAPLLAALESTVVAGANGDERGYGPQDREGVSPDDMYFARFAGMRFSPVKDDLLSTGLPVVAQ